MPETPLGLLAACFYFLSRCCFLCQADIGTAIMTTTTTTTTTTITTAAAATTLQAFHSPFSFKQNVHHHRLTINEMDSSLLLSFQPPRHAANVAMKLRAGMTKRLENNSIKSNNKLIKNKNSNNKNVKEKVDYHWTRQNLALIVPAWAGLLADPLLRVLDTILVSRVGSTELAALGVCTSIFGIAFGIFLATTMATTSLVAAASAAASTDTATSKSASPSANEIIIQSFQIALLVGILVLVGLRCGSHWILSTLLGVQPTSLLYAPACQYLHIRCWAAPAFLLVMVAEGAFRGLGDTRTPLLASTMAALINVVLDPILMFGLGYGLAGAAAATAIAQFGAVAVYAYFLQQRNILSKATVGVGVGGSVLPVQHPATTALPPLSQRRLQSNKSPKSQPLPPLNRTSRTRHATTLVAVPQKVPVLRSILTANLSMLTKQGSTVFFYAYAAALATGLGNDHVAAHQVGLSVWLLFTYWLDAASVSGQVLMSQTSAEKNPTKVKSLIRYMVQWAMAQGMVSMVGMTLVCTYLVPQPGFFTNDPLVQRHLVDLMPIYIAPQILVSLVLVLESMVVGGKQFQWMAVGTTLCTILAATRMQQSATTVMFIWTNGFITLFLARLVNAILGMVRVVALQYNKP